MYTQEQWDELVLENEQLTEDGIRKALIIMKRSVKEKLEKALKMTPVIDDIVKRTLASSEKAALNDAYLTASEQMSPKEAAKTPPVAVKKPASTTTPPNLKVVDKNTVQRFHHD